MGTFRFLKASLAAALAALAIGYASPVSAQATRTWVSGVGDDVNPCSRTAPCKTFAGAISKTAAGGEINCLDPGGYGAVTITKSITIYCPHTVAGVVVAATNGIVVNDGGTGTAVVTLEGLDIEGLGFAPTAPGVRGILFTSGASLTVKNTRIRGFRDAANGAGIAFTPSGAAKLTVIDSEITGNGNSNFGGGIVVQPTGAGGSANVTIERSTIANNGGAGIVGNTTGNTSAGGIRIAVANSSVSNNQNGISAVVPPSTSRSQITVTGSTVGYNAGVGVVANGTTAQVVLRSTTVTGNASGLVVGGAGTIVSFGDNVVFNNTTNGAPTSTVPTI